MGLLGVNGSLLIVNHIHYQRQATAVTTTDIMNNLKIPQSQLEFAAVVTLARSTMNMIISVSHPQHTQVTRGREDLRSSMHWTLLYVQKLPGDLLRSVYSTHRPHRSAHNKATPACFQTQIKLMRVHPLSSRVSMTRSLRKRAYTASQDV